MAKMAVAVACKQQTVRATLPSFSDKIIITHRAMLSSSFPLLITNKECKGIKDLT